MSKTIKNITKKSHENNVTKYKNAIAEKKQNAKRKGTIKLMI